MYSGIYLGTCMYRILGVYVCACMWRVTCLYVLTRECPGDWHDELLILSKGQAKTTKNSRGEENTAVYVPSSPRSEDISEYTLYEPGTFWGEMQFLGLQVRILHVCIDLAHSCT